MRVNATNHIVHIRRIKIQLIIIIIYINTVENIIYKLFILYTYSLDDIIYRVSYDYAYFTTI